MQAPTSEKAMQEILIDTPRLILKGITPEMIHNLFRSKQRNEIMDFFGVDDAGFNHLKMMHEGGMETFRISQFSFLLVEKSTGIPIGDCGFHTWNRTHRRADLYYGMRSDAFRQKGFMTVALPHVIRYGFTALGLHRIAAMVGAFNVPSLRLLHKNGFVKEGTAREDYCVDGKNEDSECYSLLKWEWENQINQYQRNFIPGL